MRLINATRLPPARLANISRCYDARLHYYYAPTITATQRYSALRLRAPRELLMGARQRRRR